MITGILGGTFDPVHRGHTYIADEVQRVFALDKILFMIARQPPHKPDKVISEACHRYAMVVMAILHQPELYASLWEIHREGPSYTIDTLRHFKQTFPDSEFCFIAGSDSLNEIHLWKDYDKLFLNFSLVFVQRPGAEVELDRLEISAECKESIHIISAEEKPEVRSGQSFLISIDAPPISSSAIRKAFSAGEDLPAGYLQPNVFQYIQKYRLYEGDEEKATQGL